MLTAHFVLADQAVAGEEWRLILKRQPGRVTGDDAGGVDHEHVGLERLQIGHNLALVDVYHIDLAQVGLNLPPADAIPPVRHIHTPRLMRKRHLAPVSKPIFPTQDTLWGAACQAMRTGHG